MSPIMIFHVVAGIVSVFFGATALLASKGSPLHRAAGNVFVFAMLAMATAGATIAFEKNQTITFLAGIFSCYLVATSWVTIRRDEPRTGAFEYTAMLVALLIGGAGILSGLEALNSDTGVKDGVSHAPYLVFGGLALLAAAFDLSVLIRRGISGAQRIARHLWRMCLGLYIAVGSLFTGPGAQVFPESIRGSVILSLPELVVMLLMLFWWVRVLLFAR